MTCLFTRLILLARYLEEQYEAISSVDLDNFAFTNEEETTALVIQEARATEVQKAQQSLNELDALLRDNDPTDYFEAVSKFTDQADAVFDKFTQSLTEYGFNDKEENVAESKIANNTDKGNVKEIISKIFEDDKKKLNLEDMHELLKTPEGVNKANKSVMKSEKSKQNKSKLDLTELMKTPELNGNICINSEGKYNKTSQNDQQTNQDDDNDDYVGECGPKNDDYDSNSKENDPVRKGLRFDMNGMDDCMKTPTIKHKLSPRTKNKNNGRKTTPDPSSQSSHATRCHLKQSNLNDLDNCMKTPINKHKHNPLKEISQNYD